MSEIPATPGHETAAPASDAPAGSAPTPRRSPSPTSSGSSSSGSSSGEATDPEGSKPAEGRSGDRSRRRARSPRPATGAGPAGNGGGDPKAPDPMAPDPEAPDPARGAAVPVPPMPRNGPPASPAPAAPAPAASSDPSPAGGDDRNPELPDRHFEGRPKSVEAAQRALVPRKPRIGDTMPAPPAPPSRPAAAPPSDDADDAAGGKRRRRGGRGRGGAKKPGGSAPAAKVAPQPVRQVLYDDEPVELDERSLRRRRGRERKGRPIGRYLMCVHVAPNATQIAVLEGRALVEHYVSHPADAITEIHGNIYLGRVQNVLPGMEAAFVDIGTPKNAVLYRGDVQYDKEDIESDGGSRPRIEQVLRARQTILCQVTKNPIGHKGARLTQEVSLPGRFVVLIPNSSTYGISKRLPDNERRRLRQVLDRVKPPQHGVIVRTAAENVTEEEIERDVRRLNEQWEAIEALAKRSSAPALLYREPDLALRVIREELSEDYRGILIDDQALYEEVRSYVAAISPALADRVELYDPEAEALPLFERHHVHEQRLRALDKKVWLHSGGSLIIEHTEALTVIDVNTGKNVGSSSLEETVFRNNLEAAEEIARQLRLRDIGGIIVIDFVDMESRENRDEVVRVFREALARDKTRTQVFEISELGLVEMTRKRIGEGLIESVSTRCPHCDGRGLVLDEDLVGEQAT